MGEAREIFNMHDDMEGKLNEKESDLGWSKNKGASSFTGPLRVMGIFVLLSFAIQVLHVQKCVQEVHLKQFFLVT